MKIKLETTDGLPEAIAGLVESGDDGSSLDLSKLMPAEDLTGLKTALVKERENAAAWKKYGTPDEVAAKLADLEERASKGGKAGDDAQAKIDQIKADYEAKLTDANGRFQQMAKAQTMASLKAELAKAGVVAQGLDMMATFAASRIQYNDDGSPKVMTADGAPMIGNGADHGATLGELAAELAKSMPYLVKDSGASGGGKPPGSNGGTPAKSIQRSQFDAMSPPERTQYLSAGGAVVE